MPNCTQEHNIGSKFVTRPPTSKFSTITQDTIEFIVRSISTLLQRFSVWAGE